MKTSSAFLAGLTLLAALISSCSKSNDGPSRAALLQGTWKSVQTGADNNRNGSWDASEHETVAAADVLTVIFNADGTGNESASGLSVPMTWSLQQSDNDLRIIDTAGGKPDTTNLNIVTLNGTDAVMKNQATSPASYTALKKQ